MYIVYLLSGNDKNSFQKKDNGNYKRKWSQWERFLSTLSIYFPIKCNIMHIVPHNQRL